MANFELAYKTTAGHEGGYVIDTNGYEAYRGINREYNPTWAGWAIIDSYKQNYPNRKIPQFTIFNNPTLDQLAMQNAKAKYWDVLHGDEIISQGFANFLYDFHYASGALAVQKLQSLLGVTVDGGLGPKTLAALNAALKKDLKGFYDKFWNVRMAFNETLRGTKYIPESWWPGVKERLESYKNSIADEIGAIASTAVSTVKKKSGLIVGIILLILFIAVTIYLLHLKRVKHDSHH